MLFGEVLVLLTFIGSVFAIFLMIPNFAKRLLEKRERYLKMKDDLLTALASNDYRKIDDWLLVYADEVTPKMKEQAERRRNELYVESNP